MYDNQKSISLYNNLAEANANISFPKSITISDCILRDGEQMAGLAFNIEDKINIATALDNLGVDEIESGMPASSDEDKEAVKRIVSKNYHSKITVISRATKSDIDIAYNAGVWGVSISLPFGDLQRKHKIKWTDEELIEKCISITSYAKEKGLYVILSPYDTTRVGQSFLKTLLESMKTEGTIDRMRLVDTVGAAHPEGMRALTNYVKSIYDVELEIHCHDDFGLGTANTLSALSSGAEVASVTMNGVGERSGNTALEEVVTSLEILYGVKTNIKMEKLKETSEIIESITGVELQKHKAVVGYNSFRHESGMVVAGLLKEPFVAEAIRPEIVGQKREIVVGKGSGKASLIGKLNELELSEKNIDLDTLLEKIKSFAVNNRRALTKEELFDLYNAIKV